MRFSRRGIVQIPPAKEYEGTYTGYGCSILVGLSQVYLLFVMVGLSFNNGTGAIDLFCEDESDHLV